MTTYERIIKKLNDQRKERKEEIFTSKNDRGIQKALMDVAKIDKDLANRIAINEEIVKTKDLIKIAKALNTSTDYLLGLTDSDSSNLDMKAMSERLGLSTKSLKNIWFLTTQKKNRNDINSFFEEYLPSFMFKLEDYILFDHKKYNLKDFSPLQYESLCFDEINKLLQDYKYSLPITKAHSQTLIDYYKSKIEQLNNQYNKAKNKKNLTRHEEAILQFGSYDIELYSKRVLELSNISHLNDLKKVK